MGSVKNVSIRIGISVLFAVLFPVIHNRLGFLFVKAEKCSQLLGRCRIHVDPSEKPSKVLDYGLQFLVGDRRPARRHVLHRILPIDASASRLDHGIYGMATGTDLLHRFFSRACRQRTILTRGSRGGEQ